MIPGLDDVTERFVIGRGAVRGESVRLTESWQSVLARRSYPGSVISVLGECLAASALVVSTLKLPRADGRLSIQIQGGKPISLLVAECRADLSLRAMARFDALAPPVMGTSLNDLARGAAFALTIDPGGDYDASQSLVPIEGLSVAGALNAYMEKSEQIESHFVLAASASVCAGLLVQRVTGHGGREAEDDPDLWNRVRIMISTFTKEELLDLRITDILHRLFHQEEVRLLPARAVSFACPCSRERVASVLRVLGRDEIRGLLADRRTVEVGCDFCGLLYTLSAEEAWAALA